MTIIKKSLNYWENYWRVTQRCAVSGCCWKDGASRLARHKVAINLQRVKSAISAAMLCPHCRDPEPLHHACSPFTLPDPCLHVAILLIFTSNPMSMVWLVFWSCSLTVPMGRTHVNNVLGCDTKITAALLVLGEVSFAGYKVLASYSYVLSSFAHSLPPPLSYFLLLSLSCILNVAIEKSNNLYTLLQIICFFHLCCCCSVAKLCLTLCKPTNCSPPGFPVLSYLP